MTFKPVLLEWGGREYTIEPRRVLGAIALIEESLSLTELSNYSLGRVAPRMVKIAQVYTSLLQYAGCKEVSTEEVYAHLFGKDEDGRVNTTEVILGLLLLMVPPQYHDEEVPTPSSKKTKGRGASSKKPTSSPAVQSS